MNTPRRFNDPISSRPWWPYAKYGSLALLVALTAYVVAWALMNR